jgi:hypothetical protein
MQVSLTPLDCLDGALEPESGLAPDCSVTRAQVVFPTVLGSAS